ncbi:MAG TPA: methyltransferase [Roseiflexaceae bacterium]|nr:methyltransferase [Roseiflexaceae bacterium]
MSTPIPPEDDPYFKNRLSLEAAGVSLELCTAALLFSAHRIDDGWTLLLETLRERGVAPQAVLEPGCNYGAIGLALAKMHPGARVVLADKDLLALRYTEFNRRLNGLDNAEVVGGVGLEGVPQQEFDLAVCDMPAKIGDRAIEHDFVLAPLERLVPGGSYWIVADSQLNRLLPGIARRRKLSLTEVIRRSGRIVFCFKKR